MTSPHRTATAVAGRQGISAGIEPGEGGSWQAADQALRFDGKIVAGFLLGLLVARRGARAVTTGLITAAGVLWLLGMRGTP